MHWQFSSPFEFEIAVSDNVFAISLFLQMFLPHTPSMYFKKQAQIKNKFVELLSLYGLNM